MAATRSARWRVIAAVVLIAAMAALPWAVPALPRTIAGLVPTWHDPDPATQVVDSVLPPDAQTGMLVPPRLPPPGPPQDRSSRPPASGPSADHEFAGEPLEVVVRRLGVRSPVTPISGQSGALVPPADPQRLGWWQEGAAVGAAIGSAVVTGHTVHSGGGAFDHLGMLVAGDRVSVRTQAGWIEYRVDATEVISTDELARRADDLFDQRAAGRLLLITCDDWNGTRYESNAVVFATPSTDRTE